jgi:outer membrane protein OmpA-like peptidoglycan-associated protein
METFFTIKRVFVVLCLLAMPALAGCHTTAGFGRDVQQVGRWIEGGAQDSSAWLYGSEAQAAEMQPQNTGSEQTGPQQTMTPTARTPEASENAIYFSTGSAEIPPDGLEVIREIAAGASGFGEGSGEGTGTIEVIGYTDTAGSAEFNEELSKRRAEAVAEELAAQGVPREFINVQWRGEDQLPVETGDDVHEPQNRRVSIATTST